MIDYNWIRYWHKLSETPRIFNGFLSTLGEYESISYPFNKFSKIPCLAMLGEPGMGKSREIKKIAAKENKDEKTKIYTNLNSIGSENTLIRKIFESDKIKSWKESDRNF